MKTPLLLTVLPVLLAACASSAHYEKADGTPASEQELAQCKNDPGKAAPAPHRVPGDRFGGATFQAALHEVQCLAARGYRHKQ